MRATFVPVRARSLKTLVSMAFGRASERERTRANAEPCHSCHAITVPSADFDELRRDLRGGASRLIHRRPLSPARQSSADHGGSTRLTDLGEQMTREDRPDPGFAL